jgi:hypothetical protein
MLGLLDILAITVPCYFVADASYATGKIASGLRLALSLRDCSSISPSLLPSSFGTRSAPGSEPFVPASRHRSSSSETRCARHFLNFS